MCGCVVSVCLSVCCVVSVCVGRGLPVCVGICVCVWCMCVLCGV